jgi:hypothetical protein
MEENLEKNYLTDEEQDELREREETSKEKEVPFYEKTGISEELKEYYYEMKKWMKSHWDDFAVFFEYGASFVITFNEGKGFYHRANTVGGLDEISFDVREYKDLRERGFSQQEALLFFFALHEFGHLKRILTLDIAGYENVKEQAKYLKRKKIGAKANPEKKVPLGAFYHNFYNILEDVVVNKGALGSVHFLEKENQEAIEKFYTEKAFPVFLVVKDGEGDYAPNPNPLTAQRGPIIFVGEGKGNLKIAKKEDYEKGFDWNKTYPPMQRRGQFITFFMKRYMLNLKEKDIYEEKENPEGKFILDKDAALALTKPLVEVYEILLEKIVEKYKNDPINYKRYLDFMKDIIPVAVYKEQDYKIVKDKIEYYPNVVNRAAARGEKLNVKLAKVFYEKELRETGIRNAASLTFFQLFDELLKKERSVEKRGRLDFKYNIVEATKIMRRFLEPIYTMLSILDDSFEIQTPPEAPPRKGDKVDIENIEENEEEKKKKDEKEKKEKGKPQIAWRVGMKVRDRKTGKKAIITNILPSNKVTIEYISE